MFLFVRDVPIRETTPVLYHIRYLLRTFFDGRKDKKLMNIDHDDLGFKLHRLAIMFNSKFKVEVNIFEDENENDFSF